jgi:hypothetical protein
VGWQPNLHGGRCKINWQRVCRPIKRDVLGIANLEQFGRALRLRWLWHQWLSPEKPWIGSELPIDSLDEALFAAATKVTVHNGISAKFWSSSWLRGGALALMFPALFQHARRKNRTIADTMRNDNWIVDVLCNITPTLLIQYTMLWILVDEVAFDPEDDNEDKIVWTRSFTGMYTAKLAFEIQFDGSSLSMFPVMIWRVWVPARCKFFSWLLL